MRNIDTISHNTKNFTKSKAKKCELNESLKDKVYQLNEKHLWWQNGISDLKTSFHKTIYIITGINDKKKKEIWKTCQMYYLYTGQFHMA